ncbi:MDR family MFS transporter [Georgenia alba]|uniref:MDR family MFS transporter n=1 Tax=Georgenia alba TaxID=2233858 RepID=A0ABW2Q8H3_9MICO
MSIDERPSAPTEHLQDEAPSTRVVQWVIGLMLAATFVMVLNETIMSVAIPRLMVDLGISASTAQWLTTAFMLTMAVVIPTTGFLLRRFSTRSVFIAAMSLFTGGTLLASLAPGFGVLLAGRVLQASGTAVMAPLLLTTVLTFVPAHRRGSVMGLITIVMSVAPAIGPTLSGAILEHLAWRWMFLFMLPIAALALVVGIALVRNVTTPAKAPFDLPSVVLSAVAFAGLIYGLNAIGEAASHETSVPPWLPIGAGAMALFLFVRRQLALQETESALLDLRPFRTPAFTIGISILLVAMCAMFGTIVLLPLFLQNVWGLSTLETGLVMLPGGLVMGSAAPLIGALSDRVGPRPLAAPGAVAATVALLLLTTLDTTPAGGEWLLYTDREWKVVGIYTLLTVGLSCMITPLMTSALGSVPVHLYSHASAIQNTLQQVAGAAGTALFVTVMTRTMTAEISSGQDQALALSTGIQGAFWWGTGFAVLATALSLFVRRREESDQG